MSVSRGAAVVGLAVAFSLTAVAAQAALTQTTHNLNLRSGPSTHYGVIVVIPAGSSVDIHSCGHEWCYMTWAGHAGYSNGHYLVTHVTHAVPVLAGMH